MDGKPREIVTNIGRHRLFLRYVPGAPVDDQWSWILKVTQTYEYSGRCATPDDCAAHAKEFVDFHSNMEARHGTR